jgi:hypothetical protein
LIVFVCDCRWKQIQALSAGGWLQSTVQLGRCRTEARSRSYLWSSWTVLANHWLSWLSICNMYVRAAVPVCLPIYWLQNWTHTMTQCLQCMYVCISYICCNKVTFSVYCPYILAMFDWQPQLGPCFDVSPFQSHEPESPLPPFLQTTSSSAALTSVGIW